MKAWSGLLLVADIVAFSERSQRDQVAMLQHLLAGLRADAFVQGRGDERSYVNSTGDGFVYATSAEGDLELPLEFCAFAARLVTHAATYANGMQIRVGLHVGSIVSQIPDAEGFSVGSGINWCARICDLAAPSQVLLSEELCDDMAARVGEADLHGKLVPVRPDRPFSALVKHQRVARFRAWLATGLSQAAPPRLVRAEEIRRHLEKALEIVGESIVAALRGDGEHAAAATTRLAPRVSVWLPGKDATLQVLQPRVVLVKGDKTGVGGGRTSWPTRGGCGGPVSAAFVHRRLEWLIDLPDPKANRDAYYERWSGVDVPGEMVDGFSRHARSLVAVPLILFEDPIGVLCVDLMDPLTGREEAVRALAEQLQVRSGYFVTALLHLWRG